MSEKYTEEYTINYTNANQESKELVRTFEYFNNDFPLDPRYHLLHSQLRTNPFYKELLEVFVETLEEYLEEHIHPKIIKNNPYYYSNAIGSSYDEDMREISTLLNHTPDYYLLPLLFNNTEREIEWKKFDILSIHFRHRYRISKAVYNFIFSNIWKHGGVYLEVFYPGSTGDLNPFSGKAVRLVDNTPALNEFIPPTGAQWPRIGLIDGHNNYESFRDIFQFRFDVGDRTFDEGTIYEGNVTESEIQDYDVDVDPVLFFDGQTYPIIEGKNLLLSMSLDQVMSLPENTLHLDEPVLQDIPFLQYVERQAHINKKIVENIRVGSQLTLACDISGFYLKGSGTFSFPDIRAKVAIVPVNYNTNNEPAYVRLGTGVPSSALNNVLFRTPGQFQKKAVFGTSSVYTESVYSNIEGNDLVGVIPEETLNGDEALLANFRLVEPLFGTPLGDYEKLQLNANVRAVNTVVEKQELNGMSSSFSLYQNDVQSADMENASFINIPHEELTDGTFKSIISLDHFHIAIGLERVRPSNADIGLYIRDCVLKHLLFDKRNPNYDTWEAEGFNIIPKLLYDFKTLSYYNKLKETYYTDTSDYDEGLAVLAQKIDDENGSFFYLFGDLRNPSTSTRLDSFILAKKDEPGFGIESLCEEFFELDVNTFDIDTISTSELSWVQEWLNNRARVEVFPVCRDPEADPLTADMYKIYDDGGKAQRLNMEDYETHACINWEGRNWQFRGWYDYFPMFSWRVYGEIIEEVSLTERWVAEAHHRVFDEEVFKNALRFYNKEVTETTTLSDFLPEDILPILESFFESLADSGIHAKNIDPEDPFKDELIYPYDSFQNPMLVGYQSITPACVVENHLRIDADYTFQVIDSTGLLVESTGINLDKPKGTIEFRIAQYTDDDSTYKFLPSASPPDSIEERGERGVITTNARLKYVVNSTKNYVDPRDLSSQIVAIREAGIFNTEDKLIAYASFPPIIYDSEINHLALNWYISDTIFLSP